MTSFLFQGCFSPQCEQATVPGFTSVAAKTSSSITTPVTLSFFVVGHLTKIRLITAAISHTSRKMLAQSRVVSPSFNSPRRSQQLPITHNNTIGAVRGDLSLSAPIKFVINTSSTTDLAGQHSMQSYLLRR